MPEPEGLLHGIKQQIVEQVKKEALEELKHGLKQQVEGLEEVKSIENKWRREIQEQVKSMQDRWEKERACLKEEIKSLKQSIQVEEQQQQASSIPIPTSNRPMPTFTLKAKGMTSKAPMPATPKASDITKRTFAQAASTAPATAVAAAI